MSTILLPILPGSLSANYCFESWPKLLLDFSNAQKAVLPGATFFSYGDTKPEPQYQSFPWLRSTDMRWYRFNLGSWCSPMNRDTNERRIWVGTLTGAGSLEYYDGGAPGTVSAVSGPAWERDTDFDGRSPMGVGDISGSSPAKSLTLGEDYGSGSHALTEAEGGVGAHTHGIGKYLNGATSLAYTGQFTVPTYTGAVVQGISGGSVTGPDTVANLFTLPSGTGALGVPSPSAFSVVHPVRGCYVIKPTIRAWYTA